MADMIGFPHLGILLQHVGKTFSVFGYDIAYYGVVLAIAMVSGIYMAMWIAKKTGQDPDSYFNLALIAIVISLLCARLYYVIFTWDYYRVHPLEIMNFRGGGLAIYGGVIGGVITCVIYAWKKKMHPLVAVDTACIGLILGQSIGRWGNFFNREAFGGYTNNLLAMQLPVDAIRSSEITAEMMEHAVKIGDQVCVQVHPTFLYESLWNLGVLMVLILLTLHDKKRFKGKIFTCYLFGYGLGRFWIEGLRTDQLLLHWIHLPVSQILSGIIVIAAAGILIYNRIKDKKNKAE